MYILGNGEKQVYTPKEGDIVLIRVDKLKNTLEWAINHPQPRRIAKKEIPLEMRSKDLYPSIHIGDNKDDNSPKLRIL